MNSLMDATTTFTNVWQAVPAIVTFAITASIVAIRISTQVHDCVARIAPFRDQVKEHLLRILFATRGFTFQPHVSAISVIFAAIK